MGWGATASSTRAWTSTPRTRSRFPSTCRQAACTTCSRSSSTRLTGRAASSTWSTTPEARPRRRTRMFRSRSRAIRDELTQRTRFETFRRSSPPEGLRTKAGGLALDADVEARVAAGQQEHVRVGLRLDPDRERGEVPDALGHAAGSERDEPAEDPEQLVEL